MCRSNQKNPGYGADFLTKNITSIILFLLYQTIYLTYGWNHFWGGVGLSVHAPFRVATEKPNLPCRKWILDFSQMLVPHSFT